MGKGEAVGYPGPEKTPPPAQEQPIVTQPYPDWAAMQAYYGPGVPMTPPYFSTTVAPGHPPYPYMWGPQPLMSPYPPPYTLYPYGAPPNLSASTPPTDVLANKSPDSKDRGLMKKLKGFNGLAVSTDNVNTEIKVGNESMHSRSEENGVEGSSAASDENNESRGKDNHRKRSSEDSLTSGDKVCVAPITPQGVPMYTLPSANQMKVEVHHEAWTKDERELKRERRKQSNRESARRSRLRKQAETEELAIKVESIGTENTSLRCELNQLKQSLECLRAENSLLLEKLKEMERNSDKIEEDGPRIVVENFLSRIDENEDDESSRSNSNPKLHQLLDSKPRNDAVVAG